jgi:hypothetical protein
MSYGLARTPGLIGPRWGLVRRGLAVDSEEVDPILAQVTQICAGLPECTLEAGHGDHRTIAVNGKRMGWYLVDHHGDGRIALTVRAAKGDNVALVAEDPARFFMPPYVAHHGYVGYYLDTGAIDWDEVRELLAEAYRLVAPKRLVRLLDEREESGNQASS